MGSDSKLVKKGSRNRAAVGRSGASGTAGGLRFFSLKVVERIRSRAKTTYNAVAQELVQELNGELGVAIKDGKSIRRRCYDAINVLLAAGLIKRDDKKQVVWRGHGSVELDRLQAELENRQREVERKALLLQARSSAGLKLHVSEDRSCVEFQLPEQPLLLHDGIDVLLQLHQLHAERGGPGRASAGQPPAVAAASDGAASPAAAPGRQDQDHYQEQALPQPEAAARLGPLPLPCRGTAAPGCAPARPGRFKTRKARQLKLGRQALAQALSSEGWVAVKEEPSAQPTGPAAGPSFAEPSHVLATAESLDPALGADWRANGLPPLMLPSLTDAALAFLHGCPALPSGLCVEDVGFGPASLPWLDSGGSCVPPAAGPAGGGVAAPSLQLQPPVPFPRPGSADSLFNSSGGLLGATRAQGSAATAATEVAIAEAAIPRSLQQQQQTGVSGFNSLAGPQPPPCLAVPLEQLCDEDARQYMPPSSWDLDDDAADPLGLSLAGDDMATWGWSFRLGLDAPSLRKASPRKSGPGQLIGGSPRKPLPGSVMSVSPFKAGAAFCSSPSKLGPGPGPFLVAGSPCKAAGLGQFLSASPCKSVPSQFLSGQCRRDPGLQPASAPVSLGMQL
ncbi:hypothetical protein GPECTOR_22E2FR [Gonium pectorale]|uniref:E2F/DP family winged-helix DNA-binding domain-containing protein n=1 Tax=Gonium pectorale TaxID=33097 RepID=A0A150GHA4_GONPE|nr:hypothetical protein GPECTOR_22E2FR [Gonium pectorale]|eukprot:KXZ49173.1 hypothetical protein GPECTOR_22E2FR [Gonium pectorale]